MQATDNRWIFCLPIKGKLSDDEFVGVVPRELTVCCGDLDHARAIIIDQIYKRLSSQARALSSELSQNIWNQLVIGNPVTAGPYCLDSIRFSHLIDLGGAAAPILPLNEPIQISSIHRGGKIEAAVLAGYRSEIEFTCLSCGISATSNNFEDVLSRVSNNTGMLLLLQPLDPGFPLKLGEYLDMLGAERIVLDTKLLSANELDLLRTKPLSALGTDKIFALIHSASLPLSEEGFNALREAYSAAALQTSPSLSCLAEDRCSITSSTTITARSTCPKCGRIVDQENSVLQFQAKLWGISIADFNKIPYSELLRNLLPKKLSSKNVALLSMELELLIELGLGYASLDPQRTLSAAELSLYKLYIFLSSQIGDCVLFIDQALDLLSSTELAVLIKVLIKYTKERNLSVVVLSNRELFLNAAAKRFKFDRNGVITFNQEDVTQFTAKTLNKVITIAPPAMHLHIGSAEWAGLDLSFPCRKLIMVRSTLGTHPESILRDYLYPLINGRKSELGQLESDQKIGAAWLVNAADHGFSKYETLLSYIGAEESLLELIVSSATIRKEGITAEDLTLSKTSYRCSRCQGLGQLLLDRDGNIATDGEFIICDSCHGFKFTTKIAALNYRGINLRELFRFSVDRALQFFRSEEELTVKLDLLSKLGLGAVEIGALARKLGYSQLTRIQLGRDLLLAQRRKNGVIIGLNTFISTSPEELKLLQPIINAFVATGGTFIFTDNGESALELADYVLEFARSVEPFNLGRTIINYHARIGA